MSGNRWFRDTYSDAVWECETLTAVEKAVAETYARHARDAEGSKSPGADLAWLTYPRLMAKAGIGRRANVKPAVDALVDAGWLQVEQQVSRRATLYRLTIPAGSSDGGTTGAEARGSDDGTTDPEATGSGGSTPGTTVVPLDRSGSSVSASGSSDGGTQPLEPLEEQPLSLSPREAEAAPPVAAELEDRERDDSDQDETPADHPLALPRRLLAEHCAVTDVDEADELIGWIESKYDVRHDGFWIEAVRNGSIHARVAEARAARREHAARAAPPADAHPFQADPSGRSCAKCGTTEPNARHRVPTAA